MMEEIKYYVVLIDESFKDAIEAHEDDYFPTIKEANEWAILHLEPNEEYFICTKAGVVMEYQKVTGILGHC